MPGWPIGMCATSGHARDPNLGTLRHDSGASEVPVTIDALLHAPVYSPLGPTNDWRQRVTGYTGVLIFAIFIVGFAVSSLVLAWLLRPARPDLVKLANYECGAEPIG